MKAVKRQGVQKGVSQTSGQRIWIIGPHRLFNEMAAHFLESEIDVECAVKQDMSEIRIDGIPGKAGGPLVLVDCLGADVKWCEETRELFGEEIFTKGNLAFINVRKGQGIEGKAVKWRLRGLFYEDEPLDHFLRGVQAIRRGELWLSGEIMKNHILGEYARKDQGKDPKAILTRREVEVLSAIASGAKNEEIAKELHVSLSTVKTHIYSIFKKIDVPNRLQAALWAAKYL